MMFPNEIIVEQPAAMFNQQCTIRGNLALTIT